MSNEFKIETYGECETFEGIAVVESRDKAFDLVQAKANAASTNWTNNHQKYLTQHNITESIRMAFHYCHNALIQFNSSTGRSRIAETTERHLLLNYISDKLGYISTLTELFWDEFSHNKDRLSYKFGSRVFPTGEEKWSENFEDTAKTPKPDVVEPEEAPLKSKQEQRTEINALKKATMERIFKQYDINDVQMRNFMDRSYVDEDNNGTFKPLDPSQYYDLVNMSDVEHMFKICYECHLYSIMLLLWGHLVSSKSFAHIVLGNEYILGIMFNPNAYSHEVLQAGKVRTICQNLFMDDKYREIVYHYLFYGIYILCREEYQIKTKATDQLRYNMDMRCLSKIPPYNGPLASNPFIPVTLSDKYLYSLGTENKNRVIRPLRTNNNGRGIYSVDSFKKRFEIFTDEIFKGLDYDKLYFTGSLIAACAIKNPLERKFGIDLSIEQDSIYESRDVGTYWYGIKRNLMNYFDEYYPSKNIMRMDNMPADVVAEIESNMTDIDVIVDAIEDDHYDRVCARVYETIKSNLIRRFGSVSSADVCFVRVETGQSYKYHIYGKLLIRTIELFRVYDLRPVGCISRFHFAAVRAYFDGNTVWGLPSFVCCANTGLCADYKWFSNSKKPQTLICKYFVRGFYCLLNNDEQKSLCQFMADNPAWSALDESPMLASDETDSTVRDTSVSLMSPIFNPRVNNIGTYYELNEKYGDRLKPAPSLKYIQDMVKYDERVHTPQTVTNEYGIDLGFRYSAGHIKSVNMWHMMPYLKDLNRSKNYSAQ